MCWSLIRPQHGGWVTQSVAMGSSTEQVGDEVHNGLWGGRDAVYRSMKQENIKSREKGVDLAVRVTHRGQRYSNRKPAPKASVGVNP